MQTTTKDIVIKRPDDSTDMAATVAMWLSNPFVTGLYKESPLHHLASGPFHSAITLEEILRKLSDYDRKDLVNREDHIKKTPLHYATYAAIDAKEHGIAEEKNDYLQIIEILINTGADFTRDYDGSQTILNALYSGFGKYFLENKKIAEHFRSLKLPEPVEIKAEEVDKKKYEEIINRSLKKFIQERRAKNKAKEYEALTESWKNNALDELNYLEPESKRERFLSQVPMLRAKAAAEAEKLRLKILAANAVKEAEELARIQEEERKAKALEQERLDDIKKEEKRLETIRKKEEYIAKQAEIKLKEEKEKSKKEEEILAQEEADKEIFISALKGDETEALKEMLTRRKNGNKKDLDFIYQLFNGQKSFEDSGSGIVFRPTNFLFCCCLAQKVAHLIMDITEDRKIKLLTAEGDFNIAIAAVNSCNITLFQRLYGRFGKSMFEEVLHKRSLSGYIDDLDKELRYAREWHPDLIPDAERRINDLEKIAIFLEKEGFVMGPISFTPPAPITETPNQLLLQAARSGDIAEIVKLLFAGANANSLDEDGISAAEIAAQELLRAGMLLNTKILDRIATIRLLYLNGGKIKDDTIIQLQQHPLAQGVLSTNGMEFLRQKIIALRKTDQRTSAITLCTTIYNPKDLHHFIDLETIKDEDKRFMPVIVSQLLMRSKAELRDSDLLFSFSEKGCARIVEFLIDHAGCDVNKPKPGHGTEVSPVEIACLFGNLETVRVLLNKGANLDPRRIEECLSQCKKRDSVPEKRILQMRELIEGHLRPFPQSIVAEAASSRLRDRDGEFIEQE